ncbi:hypothetical protein EVJ58_g8850 [Rhodofomes roseus]|uniref:BTB domain-containing protein n=1 Tax=Rhodofomes roseus TaxID=34475 RepID=A0A4Y9XYF3_9APHY|nr:hypothetical protein EVJ58_g8850 [Rhodofomes roseus]
MTDANMDADAPSVSTASMPFDNPDTDLIILTSDNVQFYVLKAILGLASPFFADMLTLPVDTCGTDSSTVEVAEDSVVWDFILRVCYPVACPSSIALEQLWPLLEAAKKYDLVGVREAVRREMTTPSMLDKEALRVYLLACSYGLADVAVAAAKAYISRPPNQVFVPELQCTTSAAHFRLSQYRHACVKAATSISRDSNAFSLYGPLGRFSRLSGWAGLKKEKERGHSDLSCLPSQVYHLHAQDFYIRRVFDDYMQQSAAALVEVPMGNSPTTAATVLLDSRIRSDMASAPPVYRSASSPFDNPSADLVIRTSDHIEFHVFKLILREASPVFADMFTLPATPTSDADSAGVVDVVEKSTIWDYILHVCYPGPVPSSTVITPDQLWPLLEAATKYNMKGVRDSLRIYMLACGYGFQDVAVAAARASLRRPADERKFIPELRCATAAAYLRLLQYRSDCVDAATCFAHDPHIFLRPRWREFVGGWGRVDSSSTSRNHPEPVHHGDCASRPAMYKVEQDGKDKPVRTRCRRVLENLMKRSEEALKSSPHGGVVVNSKNLAATVQEASVCGACRKEDQPDNIVRFMEIYASEIDAAIAKGKDMSDSASTCTVLVASSPFDNPDADMVVRSSDHVEFYVHKAILKEASSVFADMTSLPTTPDTDSHVAQVTESSVGWDIILRICYPMPSTNPIVPDQYWPLLEAAKKYDMACVREAVVREMTTPRVLAQETLRVYMLACSYGYEDVARVAAKASLSQTMLHGPGNYVPELRCVTSAAYFNLLQYREKCVSAAVSLAEDRNLFLRDGWRAEKIRGWTLRSVGTNDHHPDCMVAGTAYNLPRNHIALLFRRVLDDYMARSTEKLKSHPRGDTLLDPVFIAATVQAASLCNACRKDSHPSDIVRFIKFHAAEVNAAIERVVLMVES